MRAFLEGMKPQAELAEKHRTHLAIENHGASLLDSIDSIRAFVDLNKNPRLGIALAPFHIQARGESVSEAILAAGQQLLFFYAWQYDPAMSVKQLPGLGPVDCAPGWPRWQESTIADTSIRSCTTNRPPIKPSRPWPSRETTSRIAAARPSPPDPHAIAGAAA